jgi:Tfp pilus assembly protein PilX
MLSYKISRKGVALFMVLATILIVVVLANVVLTIISNHSRLTRHEVGRIQAYYAAQAGLVYTMEQIRNGTWPFSGAAERYYCFEDSGGTAQCVDAVIPDDTIDYDQAVTRSSAYKIQIEVCRDSGGPASCLPPPTTPSGTRRLNAKVDYTYIP